MRVRLSLVPLPFLLIVAWRCLLVIPADLLSSSRTLDADSVSEERYFLGYDNELEGLKPRAFQSWPYKHDALCEKEQQWKKLVSYDQGLIFVKLQKVGGSSASGVNLRIARNIARRLQKPFKDCQANYRHNKARNILNGTMWQKSFVWTMLREPTNRMISDFFHFDVSRGGVQPSDQNFQEACMSKGPRYYQTNMAVASTKGSNNDPMRQLSVLQESLNTYNFVAITERFDESLVALQMILDLPLEDIIYLKAKASGGYDDGRYKNQCYYIVPSFLSPGMKSFFESDEWQSAVRLERAIYVAANRSLDLTIDALGRQAFQRNLKMFQEIKYVANEECSSRTVFPCLPSGELSREEDRDCYFGDAGCGRACIDQVVASSPGLLSAR